MKTNKQIIPENILAYYNIDPNKRKILSPKVKKGLHGIYEYINKQVEVEQVYLCRHRTEENKSKKTRCNIFFVVDTHLLDLDYLDSVCRKLEANCINNDIEIKFKATTLAAFEKRSEITTEEEYYVKNYGIKLYDSGKRLEILPKYMPLRYKLLNDNYQYAKKYRVRATEKVFANLIRMYIQKLGYLDIGYEEDIAKYKTFVSEITKEDYVIKIIDKYLDTNIPDKEKIKLFVDLEEYIKKLKTTNLNKTRLKKQIGIEKIKVKKDILKINNQKLIKYKELIKEKKQKGNLVYEDLKKTDLYQLYIEEKVPINCIANLYEVKDNEIKKLLKKWNISYTQTIMSSQELIKMILDKDGLNTKYDFLEEFLRTKQGIPRFMDLILAVLEKLRNKSIYPISEIWELAQSNYEPLKSELRFCISKKEPTLYYRANWCINVLLRAKLITEIKDKNYSITDRGIEFLKYCKQEKIENVTIKLLQNRYPDYMVETKINKKSNSIKYDYYLIQEQTRKIEQLDAKEIAYKIIEVQGNQKRKVNKKVANNKKSKENIARKINHLEVNKNKKLVGDKCEEAIYEREKAILIEAGREDLLDNVIWVSRDIGDGLGYDIKSVKNINGKYEEIYIEVKGTSGSCDTDFEITENEVEFSRENSDKYYLYRLGKIYSETPELKIKKGSILENYNLKPVKYVAQIKE